MSQYARAVTTATKAVRKFGRSMTLRRLVRSGPDWNPTLTPVDTPIVAVMTEYTAAEIGSGELIKVGDKKLLLDSTVEINNADRIIDGSVNYAIVRIEEIRPGDPLILYEVQIRR